MVWPERPIAKTGPVVEGALSTEQPSIPGSSIWPLAVVVPEVTILEIPPVLTSWWAASRTLLWWSMPPGKTLSSEMPSFDVSVLRNALVL